MMSRNFIALLFLAGTLTALAITVNDLSAALDSPSGVTFASPSGTISKETKYSNDHIGNWDTGKKQAVTPARGSNFLKMNGGKKSSKEERSSRVASSFSFAVKGAGTLTFVHRVATYSNDDVLVFYEDDIESPLLEIGSEYWRKKESWDGDVYFDLYAEDFWVEDSIDLPGDRYNHTIKVALLAPYDNGESFWDKESDEIVENCAWLDYFVWEPDPDMIICGFDTPDNATEFGGSGLNVTIYSNYEADGELVFDYWYTIDGSAPKRNGSNSRLYDAETGIQLPGTLPVGTVTVKVAAYDGSTLIGTYSQAYTRKLTVGTPFVASATQEPFAPGITLTLGCEAGDAELTYFYTLDGSEPTSDSAKATGNTLAVTAPGSVKVIAAAGGDVSPEALAITVTQAAPPTCAVVADGVSAGATLFADECVVTATSPDGAPVRYRMAGGEPTDYAAALTLQESATVEFASVGTADIAEALYQLNSTSISVTVTKEEANDGAWATSQVANFQHGAWNLFAVSRQLSAPRAAELVAWLHPFAYNASTRTLEQATTLVGGASYLVHSSMVEEANRPASFADGGAAAPLAGDGNSWVLTSEGAQRVWDGKSWIVAPAGNAALPGWSR